MKYTKKTFISFFILLISGYAIGQKNKIALSLYNSHGYKASIPLLEKSAESSFESREKIANSYRLNHDTKNAEIWYQYIVEETQNPLHYLYYAQTLQSNEKYELAQKYFLMYEDSTGDTMFTKQNASPVVDHNISEENRIKVKNASMLNTEKIDFSPAYYEDQIVFISNRYDKKLYKGITDLWTDDNCMAIWSASKKSDGSLNTPVPFSKDITSKFNEGPISINKEGDRMFFTRNDYNKGKRRESSSGIMKLEIYTSVKKGDDWSKPVSLDFNTAEFDEAHPAINHNGDRLYFSSDRAGGFGGMDLYYSDYKNDKWSEPVNLGAEINTAGNDVFPYIHEDGTLFYASNGRLGFGGLDLYQVSVNENQSWNKPENLGHPFNSPKDDFAIVMNKTKTEGYFTSARKGGLGMDDIYTFNRPSPLEEDKFDSDKEMATDQVEVENSDLVTLDFEPKIPSIEIDQDMKFTADHLSDAKHIEKEDSSRSVITGQDLPLSANTKTEALNTYPGDYNDISINSLRLNENNSTIYTAVPSTMDKDEVSNTKAAVAIEGTYEKGDIIELPYLYYDFNSSYIRNDVKKDLDEVVKFMTKYPSMKIELRSHTDARGSEDYNQMLSQKRANSAVSYIIKQGIDASRLVAKGYGETQLRNKCANYIECSEQEHQYNRRTEIRVIEVDKAKVEVKDLENLPLRIDKADPNRKWNWN